MGLAPLIVVLKTPAIKAGKESYNKAVHFWSKIFDINFAFGVVTGIPMEFEFGTNWSRFLLVLRPDNCGVRFRLLPNRL